MHDVKFLNRKFGLFCESHPEEFHDTLSFTLSETGENVNVELFIKFDVDEDDYFVFQVSLDEFREFERLICRGESYLRPGDGRSFVSIKVQEGKLYFQAKMINPECSYENRKWYLIQEKS